MMINNINNQIILNKAYPLAHRLDITVYDRGGLRMEVMDAKTKLRTLNVEVTIYQSVEDDL
jgi:hypothetical protein